MKSPVCFLIYKERPTALGKVNSNNHHNCFTTMRTDKDFHNGNTHHTKSMPGQIKYHKARPCEIQNHEIKRFKNNAQYCKTI
jgi:hypothetical protein